jgi:predicted dienelactone hydrolase
MSPSGSTGDAPLRADLVLDLDDGARGHWREVGRPRPVRTHLWLPDTRGPAPLVLLSHGTGGAASDLAWLAAALRSDGYAVAGVDHHGNTSAEPYVAEAFVWWWDRPRDCSVVLDSLAGNPMVLDRSGGERRIDVTRVGVAGFSLGGYTAAALLGARVSPQRLRMAMELLDTTPLPEYPNLSEELTGRYGPAAGMALSLSACAVDVSDRRVRSAFLMAPVLGAVLDPVSLAGIDRPLCVVWGGADEIAPPAFGAQVLLDLVPGSTGRSLGADVGHYEFVRDPPGPGGSSEDAVKADAVGEAVAFFARTLA